MPIEVTERSLVEEVDNDPMHWWTKPVVGIGETSRAASALVSTAEAIEYYGWRDRYTSFICAQMMTGRGIPSSFGCTLSERSSREMKSTWSALFNPPALNMVAISADVLKNKIYKNRPFLEWIPEAGKFKARLAAKDITGFTDALFAKLKVWPIIEQCGDDAMTYPAAFVKVSSTPAIPGWKGKKSERKIRIERVLAEEILLTPEEAGSFCAPRSMIQRVFVNREEAIYMYGRNKDGSFNEEVCRRLRNAPGVYPGFFDAGLQHKNIVALVEGWRLPFPDGKPGRHILAVGNIVLVDEEWERDRFPFAKMVFLDNGSSYMGQSLAEVTLPIQREIDRVSMTIAELERRNAWPRWAYSVSSKISPEMFAGPGFIVSADGSFPQLLAGAAVPKELYAERQQLKQDALQRNGISQNQSSGEKPEGLSSGIAILANIQIDDSRHVSTMQKQEDFVMDIGELIIDECESVNPRVELASGRELSWRDVADARKMARCRAFPMSRLPTLPSARAQQIQNWYDDGTIDRQQKAKLENMPDTQGFINLYKSSDDWIEWTLDTIVSSGKFSPPSPFASKKKQVEASQARFLYEATQETPDDRLMLLMQFNAAALELPEPAGAPPPGGPPMPGQGAPGPGPQAMPQGATQ